MNIFIDFLYKFFYQFKMKDFHWKEEQAPNCYPDTPNDNEEAFPAPGTEEETAINDDDFPTDPVDDTPMTDGYDCGGGGGGDHVLGKILDFFTAVFDFFNNLIGHNKNCCECDKGCDEPPPPCDPANGELSLALVGLVSEDGSPDQHMNLTPDVETVKLEINLNPEDNEVIQLVTISGIPEIIELVNSGGDAYTVFDGSVELTADQANDVYIRQRVGDEENDSDENYTLNVQATIVDPDAQYCDEDVALLTKDILVQVDAVADLPILGEAIIGDSDPLGDSIAYSIGGIRDDDDNCLVCAGHQNKNADSFLYSIDLATGETEQIGEILVDGEYAFVSALAKNGDDGEFYALAKTKAGDAKIITINPQTLATMVLFELDDDWSDLDDAGFSFNNAGELYGLVTKGGKIKLYDIPTDGDGEITLLSEHSAHKLEIGGIAIDGENNLYAVGYKDNFFSADEPKLITYNAEDGWVIEDLIIHNIDSEEISAKLLDGLSFDSDGNLWAIDNNSGKLFEIDIETKIAMESNDTLGKDVLTKYGFHSLSATDATFDPEYAIDVEINATFGDVVDGSEDHFFLVEKVDGLTLETGYEEIVDGADYGILAGGEFWLVDVADDVSDVNQVLDFIAESAGEYEVDVHAVAHEFAPDPEDEVANNLALTSTILELDVGIIPMPA